MENFTNKQINFDILKERAHNLRPKSPMVSFLSRQLTMISPVHLKW